MEYTRPKLFRVGKNSTKTKVIKTMNVMHCQKMPKSTVLNGKKLQNDNAVTKVDASSADTCPIF